MGYMRHDAIIATSWNSNHLKAAHEKAEELGLEVSEIVEGRMNHENSFLIAPDGSKEGWQDSDNGDTQRARWKGWMRAQKNMWVDWAHVSFGGDDPQDAHLVDFKSREEQG